MPQADPGPIPPPDEDAADTAARWIERLTASDPPPGDVAELRAWLSADPANARAYRAARAIWAELPDPLRRHRRLSLRVVGGTAIAAALAAVAIMPLIRHDQTTAPTEVRRLALPDGSTAWLDGDSAIDVAFDGAHRRIPLARGRVAVEAARDPARPFAVEAGDATATDIGTTFAVDRAQGLEVSVAQGIVDVARAGRTVRVRAGAAIRFDGPAPRLYRSTRDAFAWRTGRIVLNDVPLARALAELDRYHAGRIILVDGELANRRVSGTLFTTRVGEGVDAIARSEGLRVTHLPC
ncbi:FecR family protein [Sphingomonas silueang]|uniref:FecR family protein n=1 Tax=Sphingomonas silueang TaxID=3156617 RepID=UPI0032B3DA34